MNTLLEVIDKKFFIVVVAILLLGMLIGYIVGKTDPVLHNAANDVQESTISHQAEVKGSKVITVQEGDTLWGIAIEYFPNVPVLEAIKHLKEINELETETIKVGERIKLE